jgi:hypothetical protein
MPETPFQTIEQELTQSGAAAALDRLIETMREQQDWHKLFDARMLKKKHALGLPLSRPTSLQDVPDEHRKEVEEEYVAAAREAGEKFLEAGDLPTAWMYLQVIREPEKVAAALEELPDAIDDYDRLDQLTQIALYQGVHPTKGVRMMLQAHGTCSTITALDQILPQLPQKARESCAKIMVRSLYEDLRETVRRHVEQRVPMLPPGESLRSLITGREWIFEGGNYHVDVSHLNAVVRFARSIEAPAEELDFACEMAEYGSHLDQQLQYEDNPPFEEFYPAHRHFFNVLLGRNVDEGLQYFRDKLEAEPDEQDKPLLAYVLVDLLMRADRLDEAVELSAQYLADLGEEVSISFDELCAEANRLDVLKQVRQQQGDLVGFTAAALREEG